MDAKAIEGVDFVRRLGGLHGLCLWTPSTSGPSDNCRPAQIILLFFPPTPPYVQLCSSCILHMPYCSKQSSHYKNRINSRFSLTPASWHRQPLPALHGAQSTRSAIKKAAELQGHFHPFDNVANGSLSPVSSSPSVKFIEVHHRFFVGTMPWTLTSWTAVAQSEANSLPSSLHHELCYTLPCSTFFQSIAICLTVSQPLPSSVSSFLSASSTLIFVHHQLV